MSDPIQTTALSHRARARALVGGLVLVNALVWLWALLAFRHFPLLLGTAFLAYSFGLRHAVDADHIAAIDNVTRKLMQEGRRPLAVGLWFSLGHSTVVILATLMIAVAMVQFQHHLDGLRAWGGLIGSGVSALFLLLIALMNAAALRSLLLALRAARRGQLTSATLEQLPGGGPLLRLFRPLFRLVGRSWHMYPLGLLFGLGFDTATEIGLLGIAASQGSQGLPVWSILVFPALFTAGMSLVDTADGLLMVGVYGWAFVKPVRKLYYNFTITLISVLVAVAIGGIEALGLLVRLCHLHGWLWQGLEALNDDLGSLGFAVMGLFALCWLAAWAIYRRYGFEVPGLEGAEVE